MAEQKAVPELPARHELETTDQFEQARKDYERRVNAELDQLGPAYVRVTYTHSREDPPRYEELQALHKTARQQHHGDSHGLLLIAHHHDDTTLWLGLTLLTSFRDQPRCRTVRSLLDTYQVNQVRTRKPPPRAWSDITREASAVDRLPVLVHAIHGTRSGTVLAPLSWYCQAVPQRRTPS